MPVRAFATQHACDRDSAWPGEQSAAGVRNATDAWFSIPGRIAAGVALLGDGFPVVLYTIQLSMSSILEQADAQSVGWLGQSGRQAYCGQWEVAFADTRRAGADRAALVQAPVVRNAGLIRAHANRPLCWRVIAS
jgi:hypothetical protein